MRLSITSTTGSPVELNVHRGETVEGLRANICRKLRLQTDRIVLLYKDRQLTAGKLMDLGVADGSKLTLVPVIEAGKVGPPARAERSMIDVLESLTEVQISDFLSGRSPLTINLGIGSRVMYVQLQLSEENVAELQKRHRDSTIWSRSECQNGPTTTTNHCDSASACSSRSAGGSATSTPSQTSPRSMDTTDPRSLTQCSHQRSRTSFNSSAPTPSHSSASALDVNRPNGSSPHQSCPPFSEHTSALAAPTASRPSGCPHPSSPLQANAPVSSPAPLASIPGPCSPAPASTFQPKESHVNASSTTEPCKQHGAVIESLVSHSPGVFSGTFSGTLDPSGQSSISHPRAGIAIILQILNDLLRAACHHQGAPPVAPHPPCPGSTPPVDQLLMAEQRSKAQTKTVVTQKAERLSVTPGDESCPLNSSIQENQELHCKLERLQVLMHQRRLRRWTRRNLHLSRLSHRYQRGHSRP